MSLYQEVRSACQELGFRPRKGLGQHFLIHENVIKVILRLINLSEGDEIVEIGPGLGFLTRRLVAVASRVWAIEVDTMLVEWLRRTPLGCDPTLDLVHGDVLKIRFGDILPEHKVKLVANLPYNISTPVLFRLFEERDRFSLLVLMVQREVAERMAASPGTKSYGTLSIWCQIHGHILAKVSVSPEAFFPRPSVRSTVLKIGLHPKPLIAPDNLPALRALVRVAFGQRRKTLSNTFRGLLKRGRGEIEEFLLHEGIDPQRRGETLTIEEFIRLAGALKAQFEDQ
jgi:16S rRNA (adenine1518-N6/adenine1519-N6)-dimethyltransferase